MLYLDRVCLTRRTVERQFLITKGWTIGKVKERVKEERHASELDNEAVKKGFGKE